MVIINSILSTFNIKSLKPKQIEALDIIQNKQSVLIFLPTGYGKSYCYQIPAVLPEAKVTVVICPLLALIDDQLNGLKKHFNGNKDVHFYSYTSSDNFDKKNDTIESIQTSPHRTVLFTTPESLVQEDGLLSNCIIELYEYGFVERLVFDEAHCLSSWGRGFRPCYQSVGKWYQTNIPKVPITALTATATPRVRQDIALTLGLTVGSLPQNAKIVEAPTFRSNLIIKIDPRPSKKIMFQNIKNMMDINCTDDNVAIMYCLTRKECEKNAEELKKLGIKCSAYHAGMDKVTKSRIQSKWQVSKLKLVVATVAFGMGIDKSNVRLVLHSNMPKNIEGYYQEIGRGGRDGNLTLCQMYFNYSDKIKIHRMLDLETEYGKHQLDELYQMYRFCVTNRCRHEYIASSYGNIIDDCKKNCDICIKKQSGHSKKHDIIPFCKQLINTVLWLCEEQDSRKVSKTQISKLLMSKHKKLKWSIHPDRILTLMLIHGYLQESLLISEGKDYYKILLGVTKVGYDFVYQKNNTWMIETFTKTNHKVYANTNRVSDTLVEDIEYSKEMYNAIVKLRKEVADKNKLRAYNVIPNKTLIRLCQTKPLTKEEAMLVSGFKTKRFEMIGNEVLLIIKKFS